MSARRPLTVVLAAGGTGGHVFPAVAGAAGRQDDGEGTPGAHSRSSRAMRLRVSARANPMPMATANSDEPP